MSNILEFGIVSEEQLAKNPQVFYSFHGPDQVFDKSVIIEKLNSIDNRFPASASLAQTIAGDRKARASLSGILYTYNGEPLTDWELLDVWSTSFDQVVISDEDGQISIAIVDRDLR
jgi:hypothetical protein